jgi:hypothetical protein
LVKKEDSMWAWRSRAPLFTTDTRVPGLHTKHLASHSSQPFWKHEYLLFSSSMNLSFSSPL